MKMKLLMDNRDLAKVQTLLEIFKMCEENAMEEQPDEAINVLRRKHIRDCEKVLKDIEDSIVGCEPA